MVIIKRFILGFIAFCNLTYAAPGIIVIAGGGPEGDIGDKASWSYELYKSLIDNGPIHGDGKIKVVVISGSDPGNTEMVDYLKSMGATSSENVVADSKEKANDPAVVDTVSNADVIFIRGGNQGDYYRFWKDTRLHENILNVMKNGGAIGGTSAGAMSLSQYALTGGQDFVSRDVLQDAHSPLLNDIVDGKTSIHNDFLNLVPETLIETHCGERARIGRLLAVQAKAIDDYKNNNILGICLEERTGLLIRQDQAEVFGTGTVHFLQNTADTTLIRIPQMPLIYTNVKDDALTEGWKFDLGKRMPDLMKIPKNAIRINNQKGNGKFIHIKDAQAEKVDKNDNAFKGIAQTRALKSIFENTNTSVLLTPLEETIKISRDHSIALIAKNTIFNPSPDVSTIIMDCKNCTYKSLSSFVSNQDDGSNTLFSAGLINMRLHVMRTGESFNIKTRDARP